MRKLVTPTAVLLILAFAIPAFGQEERMFYGLRNIQTGMIRLSPYLIGENGSQYEVMLGFNTSAESTEDRDDWKLFYGVGLGGGGMAVADIDVGDAGRDATAGYIMLQLEERLFARSTGDVRPYLYWYVGLGRGYFWADENQEKYERSFTEYATIYGGGLEGGVQFMVNKDYAVSFGVGAEARAYALEDDFVSIYPAYATIGVCKWLGAIR